MLGTCPYLPPGMTSCMTHRLWRLCSLARTVFPIDTRIVFPWLGVTCARPSSVQPGSDWALGLCGTVHLRASPNTHPNKAADRLGPFGLLISAHYSILNGYWYICFYRLVPYVAGLEVYAFQDQLETWMLENLLSQYLLLNKWRYLALQSCSCCLMFCFSLLFLS